VIGITAAIAIGGAGDGDRWTNGTVQTVVWTMPGPLMASISVMLDPARTQTPDHPISLCGHARSVQSNWRNRKASSSNLGIEKRATLGRFAASTILTKKSEFAVYFASSLVVVQGK
jgi:hypothetical protein